MALEKDIELPSGVTVSYHRVVSVTCVTNVQNMVEVASYTSRAKREEEEEAVSSGTGMDVFVETSWHVLPYEQGMSVEDAYAWLKESVPDLKDAEDVWEDGQQEAAGQ